MSQDTEGEIASRAFRIVGVYRAEMQATEKQFAFVSMPAAQQMLNLSHGISEVAVLLAEHGQASQVADTLRGELPADEYEVNTWQELLPMGSAIMKIYDWFIFIWFLVVFIAMGFGIVNTTLMAVFERIKEFGLLKALGMKPWWIVKGVLIESFCLLVLGMAIGNAAGFVSVLAISRTGIDLSALAAGMEYWGMSRVIYPSILGQDVLWPIWWYLS